MWRWGKEWLILLWVVFFCFGFVFHHCCLVWVFFLFFVCKFLLCMHFEYSLQFLLFLWSTNSVEKGPRWDVFLFLYPCFHVLGLVFASLPKYDSSLFSFLLFVFASSVLFCQVLCWKDDRRIGVILRFVGGSRSRSRRRSLKGFFFQFWGKVFAALKKEYRKQEAQNVKCMRRGGWDWSLLETRLLQTTSTNSFYQKKKLGQDFVRWP